MTDEPVAVGYIQSRPDAYAAGGAWSGGIALSDQAAFRPIFNTLTSGLEALQFALGRDMPLGDPAKVQITLTTERGVTVVIRPQPHFGETEIIVGKDPT